MNTILAIFQSYNSFIIQTLIFIILQATEAMNKCEHSEPITLFCINDTCNWREVGGCQICFKKFHIHSQHMDTITLQKLQEMQRLFYVRPEIKLKSRILQEAVYNYFIIMKSQISASIDAVSRVITNKLNYPYLYSQGQLNVYKKIKNKQYKKMTKKELKNFYNFANTQNKDIIELNEKKLYQEEVLALNQTMKNINEAFLSYSKAVEKFDSSFNVERSFLTKIFEISSSIMQNQKNNDNNFLRDSHISNLKQEDENTLQNANITKKDSASRDRKVSLDEGIAGGIDMNRIKNKLQQNVNENEKQIGQKKKKLFDKVNSPMLTSVQNTLQAKSKEKEKRIDTSKSIQKQIIPNVTSVDNTARKDPFPQHNHLHLAEQKYIPSPSIPEHEDQHTSSKNDFDIGSPSRPEKISPHKLKNGIKTERVELQDSIHRDQNEPEITVHTTIPRQQSKPKLYEDTRDVKQRKITIPVKKFEEQQENSSPLLRKKRQKHRQSQQATEAEQGSTNEMQQINLFGKKYQKDEIKQEINEFETPKKQKQDQGLVLKDKQADSLALLIQSLPLPAQKAISLLEAALKYAHNNLSAAEYLSYLYLQVQKPKQCLQLCNKILQQLEDSPQANQLSIHISNNKAAALNMLGRYSQSIGILQKCLAYTKRDIYYKNLGDAYFSIGIYEKAIINYQNAIKLNNQMQQAFYNLAVCYYIQKHLPQAKLNVAKALKINPKNEQYLTLSRQIMIKIQV